ncbi:hypothetical protein LIER_25336 [Lithospermum erythrorhizon]|uniref:GAGA-binding transcriptional activator n=1 Tax=Lithospermum erythrorhizon TaxID=34254 RepID=A0AAV3R4E0_LITER
MPLWSEIMLLQPLQYRENSMNGGTISPCLPRCQMARRGVVKHAPQPQQPHMAEASYHTRDLHVNDTKPILSAPSEPEKSKRTKRTKEAKATTPTKRAPKSTKKVKREGEDLNKSFGKSHEWKGNELLGESVDDLNRQLLLSSPNWKNQDLGLNQVAFDGSTMPVPVCSCTRDLRPCYKWCQ